MDKMIISALKWGLIGGLAIIILQTILLLISPTTIGGIWPVITFLPLLFCMIWGGISIRKENDGLNYGNAFLSVFIIACLGTVMFVIYTYTIWTHWVDPGFWDKFWALAEVKMRDRADKMGLSDEDIDKQLAYYRNYNIEKIAYMFYSVCALIISLIVAAFVSRPDKRNLNQKVD